MYGKVMMRRLAWNQINRLPFDLQKQSIYIDASGYREPHTIITVCLANRFIFKSDFYQK